MKATESERFSQSDVVPQPCVAILHLSEYKVIQLGL